MVKARKLEFLQVNKGHPSGGVSEGRSITNGATQSSSYTCGGCGELLADFQLHHHAVAEALTHLHLQAKGQVGVPDLLV